MTKKRITLNERNLRKNVKEAINAIVIEHTSPFREVKYFHPSGKPMPNGSHYQRGGFLNECKINKDNFVLDESVHSEQYGMKGFRGGLVVFSTDVHAVKLDDNQLINKVKQLIIIFNNRINRNKKITTQ